MDAPSSSKDAPSSGMNAPSADLNALLASLNALSSRMNAPSRSMSTSIVSAPSRSKASKAAQARGINKLPDELLQRIFGHVDDSHTLLDAVPLVCERWKRLSKDPSAWASAEVVWKPCTNVLDDPERCCPETHDGMEDRARVLLHAPVLRKVFFPPRDEQNHYHRSPCPDELEYLDRISDLSKTKVIEIEIHGSWFISEGRAQRLVDATLLNLVINWEEHLVVLDLGTMALATEPSTVLILRRLKQLKSLSLGLTVRPDHDFELPDDEKGLLPHLKRLTVRTNVDPQAAGLLKDLITDSAATLHELHFNDRFHWSSSLPPAVLEQLRLCVELRDLKCNVEDVTVLPGLPWLHTLTLSTVETLALETPEDKAAAVASVSSAAAFLETCRLSQLRDITVICDLESGSDNAIRPKLPRLLEGLAAAAPRVRYLKLSVGCPMFGEDDVSVACIEIVGKRMSNLRSISLHQSNAESLIHLATKLPKLRQLVVEFQKCGGRQQHVCKCKVQNDYLRHHWPHIKLYISKPCNRRAVFN